MQAQIRQQTLRPAEPPSTPVSALAATADARLLGGDAHVTGVELRAQAVQPGDLFAALPGGRSHGAQYAGTAIEQGAAAILTDDAGVDILDIPGGLDLPVLVHPEPRSVLGALSAQIYGHPSRKLQVIGITGTSGKTTTTYLVEAALAGAGRTTGLIGTIETRMAGRRVPSALTTPEAPQLHAMFAAMVEQGIDSVVMEVSSHALALGRVDGTEFAVGAFTNLSQDHLDFHAGFDDYFAAKARLFAPESTVRAKRAVVCIDDEWGVRMAATAHAPVTVAIDRADADWTAHGIETVGGGQAFEIRGPEATAPHRLRLPTRIRLPGRYNVANATLAVAICATAGYDAATAAAALAEVDVPGRVERVDRGQDFLAVVDYAHKPAALEAVIETLRGHSTGRLAVVVGAGGDRDRDKRPLMGAAAAQRADLLIVTDDNPRTEEPAAIRAAILDGAHGTAEVREIGDRAAAIAAAVEWANEGDVVLVAGKGHEAGQEIHGVKAPFDDRDVLAAAIDKRQEATNRPIGGAPA